MGLRGPVLLGESVKLVDEPFAMDPAQGVAADVELAGVVAEDDCEIRRSPATHSENSPAVASDHCPATGSDN